MKLLVAIIIGAFFSPIALAEWLPVGKTAYGVWYVDYDQIQKDGSSREAWVLEDSYKTRSVNGIPYRSTIKRYRCDCLNKTITALEIVLYSGNMSQGKVVKVGNSVLSAPHSLTLPPESVGKVLVNEICNH